jgi:hypothetical protein
VRHRLDNYNDIKIGDVIEAYTVEQWRRPWTDERTPDDSWWSA